MSKRGVYEFRVRRVRRSCAREFDAPISEPRDAAACFGALLEGEPREVFVVASLDSKNKVLGVERVAIGNATSVDVSPREVFRAAILTGAVSVIVGHNHPSGDPSPSGSDADLTTRLRECGTVLGIPVLDHVIVTEDDGRFYSFSEHNWK